MLCSNTFTQQKERNFTIKFNMPLDLMTHLTCSNPSQCRQTWQTPERWKIRFCHCWHRTMEKKMVAWLKCSIFVTEFTFPYKHSYHTSLSHVTKNSLYPHMYGCLFGCWSSCKATAYSNIEMLKSLYGFNTCYDWLIFRPRFSCNA